MDAPSWGDAVGHTGTDHTSLHQTLLPRNLSRFCPSAEPLPATFSRFNLSSSASPARLCNFNCVIL
ncbi:hypothetical protein [Segatella oulorum]|uniref:hypothetical protein n=1 Tax=Segatella oulorum TaxID=28136 RepID=UPI001F3A22F9|nr:hypothetical protein [Segatella oulorum]